MDFIRLNALLVFVLSTTGVEVIEAVVLESILVARGKLALRMNCSGLAIRSIRSMVVHMSVTGVWLSKASFSSIFGLILVLNRVVEVNHLFIVFSGPVKASKLIQVNVNTQARYSPQLRTASIIASK